MGEIDVLIDSSRSADPKADVVPEIEDGSAISRHGDLWQLGPHRLVCGDARDPSAYDRLMDGKRAQIVFTDPPYNVAIDGHVRGLGRIKHDDFVMAAGEMTEAEFAAFLNTALKRLAEHSVDGPIHFICMDWRHAFELLTAARGIYAELKNVCVWNKDNGGMGTFYRSKHELVFVFKNGTAPHINNFELGQHGRYRTNVWDYAGMNSAKGTRSGGQPFSRGALYSLLGNPIYIGEIRHKGVCHAGQHVATIDRALWDAVQQKLRTNTNGRRERGTGSGHSPLAGKLFDEAGEPLTPSHAVKNGRRYRYYVSRSLLTNAANGGRRVWRLPAAEIERSVAAGVKQVLGDQAGLAVSLDQAELGG